MMMNRYELNTTNVSLRMMNFASLIHLMKFFDHREIKLNLLQRVCKKFQRVLIRGAYRNVLLVRFYLFSSYAPHTDKYIYIHQAQERTKMKVVSEMLQATPSLNSWNPNILHYAKSYNEWLITRRGRCVTVGFSLRRGGKIIFERLVPIHATSKFCRTGGLNTLHFVSPKRAKSKYFMKKISFRIAAQLKQSRFLRRVALPLLVRLISDDLGYKYEESLRFVKNDLNITNIYDERRKGKDCFHVNLQQDQGAKITIPTYFTYLSQNVPFKVRQIICKVHGLYPCMTLKDAFSFDTMMNVIKNVATCNVENYKRIANQIFVLPSEELREPISSYTLLHSCTEIRCIRAVELLLFLGHDPNARLYKDLGTTPLFLAAKNFTSSLDEYDLKLMRLLINAGARVEMIVKLNQVTRVPAVYNFLADKKFCLRLMDKNLFKQAVSCFVKLLHEGWDHNVLSILMTTTLSHCNNFKSKGSATSIAGKIVWIVEALLRYVRFFSHTIHISLQMTFFVLFSELAPKCPSVFLSLILTTRMLMTY